MLHLQDLLHLVLVMPVQDEAEHHGVVVLLDQPGHLQLVLEGVVTGDEVVDLLAARLEADLDVVEPGLLEGLDAPLVHADGTVNATAETRTALSALRLDADRMLALEKRFGRKLEAKVEVEADLIGGVRVVVGDEVLDTSIKARLERMKSALLA